MKSVSPLLGMASTRRPAPGREHGYPGVYRRSRRDDSGAIVYYGKWEPRLKPPREKLASGETLSYNHLPLGGHDSPEEAKAHYDIAAFYYGKAEGVLDLENGRFFHIPPMGEEEKQNLQGPAKAKWVVCKSKEVFRHFQKVKTAGSIMLTGSAPTPAASSSMPPGAEQLNAVASAQEDSTLDLRVTDFGPPELTGSCSDVFDVLALSNMSWEEILSALPAWPCEVDSNLLDDDAKLDVNSLLWPQQAWETLRSDSENAVSTRPTQLDYLQQNPYIS